MIVNHEIVNVDNMNKNKKNEKVKKPVAKAKNSGSKNVPSKKETTEEKKNDAQLIKKEEIIPNEQPTAEVEVKKPELTEEEKRRIKAAIIIQTRWRGHLARKLIVKLRVEKSEYEKKLQQLEQEAYLRVVKLEQEREEKEFEKRLKEQAVRKARQDRRKKFLDAAYDGNLTQMEFLIGDFERELDSDPKIDPARRKKLLQSELIDCKDSNNNTALSEAAAGGSAEVIRFLLSRNADVNSRGAFDRTPLWRSAFAGHVNCVQVLLENGADPRLYSTDGQRCVDAATQPIVIEVLTNWNTALTDRMLDQMAKARETLVKQIESSLEARKREAKRQLDIVHSQFESCKRELYKCKCELQRLNDEYLIKPDMYGPLIDQKENERTKLNSDYEALREKEVKARIAYKDLLSEIKQERKELKRDDNKKNQDDGDISSANSSDSDDLDDTKVLKINIREMDEIIMRDLSDVIKNSVDKWPLLIDESDQAQTFLRYRDTNYINALDVQSMQPNRLRLALIGAVRYGKAFVLDLMQYDRELLQAFRVVCQQIDPDFFDMVCSKKLTLNENYMKFVRLQTDGNEYEAHNFNQTRLDNFKVIFITSNTYPSKELINITMPIKIVSSRSLY